MTSTGQTSVTGDLGVSSGTAITGFPPGTVPRRPSERRPPSRGRSWQIKPSR
ncbi:hypothetical protein [Hyalangium sp.]|uniref:hypothetical protein n=1 Tax=Hyalangium sp. TaxID=2028555 RepID=UPI002D4043FC|nr:hypothetical protein [Hyalangium sp.]HYH99496.1 hypothetical protein [Hyalangium sp.]